MTGYPEDITLNTQGETMTPATQNTPLEVQLFRRFYNESVRAGCRPEDVPEITESELRAKYGYQLGATKPGVSIGSIPLATYLDAEGTKHAVAAIHEYRANGHLRAEGFSIGDYVELSLTDHGIETPADLLSVLNARQREFGSVPSDRGQRDKLRIQLHNERLAG